MFDIKTEAASPAASKEEEEDEDEVDWGRGGSAWLESHDWRSKQKMITIKTPNKTIPWSWAEFFPGGGRPAQLVSHPDGLAAEVERQGGHGWGWLLLAALWRVTLTKALNFPIHSVFGKVF